MLETMQSAFTDLMSLQHLAYMMLGILASVSATAWSQAASSVSSTCR